MPETEYANCGVIYVAAGEQFVEEACISAQSVNRTCPDIPITLFTDQDCSPVEFDSVRKIPEANYGFADKLENMSRTPYERTIYLDCDTYIHQSEGLYDLFDMLGEFDVAASHDTALTADAAPPLEEVYDEGVPDAFPMLQGGLLAYRNSEQVLSWLESCLERYKSHLEVDEDATDQEAIRSTLYESNLRLGTLPPEYNFRIPYPQIISGKVRILHGRANNYSEIATKINNKVEGNEKNLIKHNLVYIPVYFDGTGLTKGYRNVYPLINPRKLEAALTTIYGSVKEFGILRTILHLGLGGFIDGSIRYRLLSNSIKNDGPISTVVKIFNWLRTKEWK